MILKMMLIVFGIFLLILDLFMYARQKLTDGIGLGWAIVSATFLVSGIAFVWLAVPAGWLANFLISYAALRRSWPEDKAAVSQ